MPYGRTYKKKRSRKRKSPYTRTGGSVYLTEKGETKYVDQNVDSTAFVLNVNGTWAFSPSASTFANIGQGTGATERVGRQVLVHKIFFKGRIEVGDATFANWDGLIVKIALVIDKQTNKTQCVATDIWAADDIYHFRNLDQAPRFRVLMLKTINVNAGTSSSTDYAGRWVPLEFSHKFRKPLVIDYDKTATTGNITDMMNNSIHFMAATNARNATPTVKIGGESRTRFTDGRA